MKLENQSEQQELSIIEIIARDLNNSLSQFNDPKKGIRLISRKTNLHEKTLSRILAKETKPSYQTIFKIYKYILQIDNDNDLLNRVDPALKKHLVKSIPQVIEDNQEYTNEVDKLLIQNTIWGEIYLLASTGNISLDEIKERTGLLGLKAVLEMLELNILTETQLKRFTLGGRRASFIPETIIKLGAHLISNYSKTSNGDEKNRNFQGLYVEGLDRETYMKWLEIDIEAFYKKVELANNIKNHGDYRAFTYMTTDLMNHDKVF